MLECRDKAKGRWRNVLSHGWHSVLAVLLRIAIVAVDVVSDVPVRALDERRVIGVPRSGSVLRCRQDKYPRLAPTRGQRQADWRQSWNQQGSTEGKVSGSNHKEGWRKLRGEQGRSNRSTSAQGLRQTTKEIRRQRRDAVLIGSWT